MPVVCHFFEILFFESLIYKVALYMPYWNAIFYFFKCLTSEAPPFRIPVTALIKVIEIRFSLKYNDELKFISMKTSKPENRLKSESFRIQILVSSSSSWKGDMNRMCFREGKVNVIHFSGFGIQWNSKYAHFQGK